MQNPRKWVGELLLRSPSGLRALRDVPVLGGIIHHVSHRVIPSDQKVWAQIEDGPLQGLWIELNPRTGQNYLRGKAERGVLQALAKRLRPGMVFYDLGANIGSFSLLAARLVGEKGKVYSFEPDTEAAARLRRNVGRNSFANVTIVEAGVWSASGYVNFIPAGASSPDHGTGKLVTAGDSRCVRVPCVALDDFVATALPPDAIKCDVEGAEVEVLRGAEHILRTSKPFVLCEMHSAANDKAVRDILGRFGYAFEAVDADHVLAYV